MAMMNPPQQHRGLQQQHLEVANIMDNRLLINLLSSKDMNQIMTRIVLDGIVNHNRLALLNNNVHSVKDGLCFFIIFSSFGV